MDLAWRLLLYLTLSIVPGLGFKEQDNPNNFGTLRTKFSFFPGVGFNKEPRIMSEAKKAGWIILADGCDGDHPFPGIQMIENPAGEIILIFDKRGYIAGMRSVNPIVSPTDPDPIYLKQSVFQKEHVPKNGNESYLTTVYFVPPSKVCEGRSPEEFRLQGTGTGLYIVNGSSINDLYKVPSNIAEAKKSSKPKLYVGFCLIYMGYHALLFNVEDANTFRPDCSNALGFQFMYATSGSNELIGFVFFVPGTPAGNRWEPFTMRIVSHAFGNNYPKCYEKMVEKGVRSLHVYFGNYQQFCPK